MTTINVDVSLPRDLLERVEAIAAADHVGRDATIARLLARALRLEDAASRAVLEHRPMYATRPKPISLEAVAAALEGRDETTVRAVLEAIGVPLERADMGIAKHVGFALERLGWRVAGRRGGGARERFYRRVAAST